MSFCQPGIQLPSGEDQPLCPGIALHSRQGHWRGCRCNSASSTNGENEAQSCHALSPQVTWQDNVKGRSEVLVHGLWVELNLPPGDTSVNCNPYKSLRRPSLGAWGKQPILYSLSSLQFYFTQLSLCPRVVGRCRPLPPRRVCWKGRCSHVCTAEGAKGLKGIRESHRESGHLDRGRPIRVCLTGTLAGLGGADGS